MPTRHSASVSGVNADAKTMPRAELLELMCSLKWRASRLRGPQKKRMAERRRLLDELAELQKVWNQRGLNRGESA